MLTIVVPTIDGRELWFEKAVASIEKHTTVPYELIVKRNLPGCGPAWQAGGEQASGDYIWMAADDVEVMEGYDVAAIEACDRGVLPAPIIYHTDGRVQSCGTSWEMLEPDGCLTDFTRAPFMSRSQWQIAQPMLPTHYFTDNWVSWKCRQAGVETVVAHGYRMIHHLAPESRDEARMGADGEVFRRAVAGEDVWHAAQ